MTFTASLAASAQLPGEVKLGDLVIENYLEQRTAAISGKFLEGARNKEEWEQRRPKLREQYLEMLGLWPLPERTPLKATVTGTLERDDFRVEKLYFQSKPGLYVTGNLYLPSKVEGKLPVVLYVCGHSGRGRDGNKTAFQHHGIWFAKNGYVCLIIDTLQLGEVAGIHHGTYGFKPKDAPKDSPHQMRWWWQALGYTPAGVECWNGIRAIDYLQSRPEVDPDKIAVTGISGGGASTMWIAAADERVKVAVPVSGMSDLETYVSDKVINGHCDCMFLVNTYAWEWTTIAALIAPRPMLFLNSGHDTIFPMPGNERIRDRLEALYKFYSPKPETLFDIGVTPGGHEDNLGLRLMAYRWINRHLKNDNREVQEPAAPKIDGKELRVFPEEKDLPTDAINGRIDETFVPRAQVKLAETADQFSAWHRDRLARLHQLSFRDWPDQVPAARVLKDDKSGPLTLHTEPGIAVAAEKTARREKIDRVLLIVLGPEDAGDVVPAWAKRFLRDTDAATILSPRGCHSLAWTRKSPPNYVERAHALVGRTVDTGRVWDVQAVARYLHEHDESNSPVCVVGRGQAGIIAAYAAVFEPAVSEVIVVDPPASHNDGPIFLNVLRVLDIPDALGLLAPKPLTLIGARDKSFDRTAQLYKAAGADAKLKRQ